MGGEKTTEKEESKQQQQTQYTPTPQEQELMNLQLSQAKEFDPFQRKLNANAATLINQLLLGQSLPGYLNTLPGGISEDVVSSISGQAIQDIAPSFQKSGILDSGVAAQISARTSADIRNQATQFNIQNLMQLLNIAAGGSAQVQQPGLQTAGQLGQSLSGLRSINQTGSYSSTSTTVGMNPFLKSFQESAGQSLGTFGRSGGKWNFGRSS